jgi:purine-binding chemotaxis protein CheW
MNSVVALLETPSARRTAAACEDFLTVTVGGQLFGVPVLTVQDVLGPHPIARIPLAPKEVAGSLNLRGRIVTAIDLRTRLGIPAAPEGQPRMNLVVDRGGELYSLVVDSVGEVLSVAADRFEPNPSTIGAQWREFSNGVYRLDGRLMVVLDVDSVLRIGP